MVTVLMLGFLFLALLELLAPVFWIVGMIIGLAITFVGMTVWGLIKFLWHMLTIPLKEFRCHTP